MGEALRIAREREATVVNGPRTRALGEVFALDHVQFTRLRTGPGSGNTEGALNELVCVTPPRSMSIPARGTVMTAAVTLASPETPQYPVPDRSDLSAEDAHSPDQQKMRNSPDQQKMREQGCGANQEVRGFAAAVMSLSDRHLHNGRLTVNEMRTFLRGTAYEGFSQWLNGTGVNLGGQFHRYDLDCDGTMDAAELEEAASVYLAEGISSGRILQDVVLREEQSWSEQAMEGGHCENIATAVLASNTVEPAASSSAAPMPDASTTVASSAQPPSETTHSEERSVDSRATFKASKKTKKTAPGRPKKTVPSPMPAHHVEPSFKTSSHQVTEPHQANHQKKPEEGHAKTTPRRSQAPSFYPHLLPILCVPCSHMLTCWLACNRGHLSSLATPTAGQ